MLIGQGHLLSASSRFLWGKGVVGRARVHLFCVTTLFFSIQMLFGGFVCLRLRLHSGIIAAPVFAQVLLIIRWVTLETQVEVQTRAV